MQCYIYRLFKRINDNDNDLTYGITKTAAGRREGGACHGIIGIMVHPAPGV